MTNYWVQSPPTIKKDINKESKIRPLLFSVNHDMICIVISPFAQVFLLSKTHDWKIWSFFLCRIVTMDHLHRLDSRTMSKGMNKAKSANGKGNIKSNQSVSNYQTTVSTRTSKIINTTYVMTPKENFNLQKNSDVKQTSYNVIFF